MEKTNKNIVFLKSKNSGIDVDDEYHALASRICGLEAHSIPVLDFHFHNNEKLGSYVESIQSFSGVIFTSPRTVEALLRVVNEANGLNRFKKTIKENKVSLFVVGKSTAKALSDVGLESKGEETGSAENLAKFILGQADSVVHNKQLLFLQGNLAKDTIPTLFKSAGIDLQLLCVYETIPHPNFVHNFDKYLQNHGDPAFLVFFSPSGADFYLKNIIEMTKSFHDISIVAIGMTTCNFLKKLCRVDGVAEKPNPESLIHCIQHLLTSKEIVQIS